MAVEGYFHTRSFRKYALRMLVFAVLSEVPFNLMCGGTWFYPVHQNVIWTLLMGLLGGASSGNGAPKAKNLPCLRRPQSALFWRGAVLGILCMVDYYAVGVLTVLVFYFFRGRVWWCLAGAAARAVLAQCRDAGRPDVPPVQLFGVSFEICQQGLLRCWRSSPSGCIAGGRDITAGGSNISAMRFTLYTCWCLHWLCSS